MKTRFKHWTTWPGCIILIIGLVLLWFNKINYKEMTGFFIIASYLIGYKPPKQDFDKMRNLFLFLLIPIFLFSCSPAKRLARIERNHPELFRNDTIRIVDSIIIPENKVDTVVLWSNLNHIDTITLTKENLSVKLIRVGDTIKLSGVNHTDTLIIKRNYIEKKYIAQECKPTFKNILKHGREYLFYSGFFGFFLAVVFYSIIFYKRR